MRFKIVPLGPRLQPQRLPPETSSQLSQDPRSRPRAPRNLLRDGALAWDFLTFYFSESPATKVSAFLAGWGEGSLRGRELAFDTGRISFEVGGESALQANLSVD